MKKPCDIRIRLVCTNHCNPNLKKTLSQTHTVHCGDSNTVSPTGERAYSHVGGGLPSLRAFIQMRSADMSVICCVNPKDASSSLGSAFAHTDRALVWSGARRQAGTGQQLTSALLLWSPVSPWRWHSLLLSPDHSSHFTHDACLSR